MSKKTLNYLIMVLLVVGIIGITILASYFGSLLFTSQDFKPEYLIEFIGSVAVLLVLVGISFKLYINILGGKK